MGARNRILQHQPRETQSGFGATRGPHQALDVRRASPDYFQWIDVRGAMQHLGMSSEAAIYRLIRDHRLPYGRVGRHYRFRRDQLDQWAERRGLDSDIR